MNVEKLMAIIGDKLKPDLSNLKVFVETDIDYTGIDYTDYILDFNKHYELYKSYTVVSYTMSIDDPRNTTYTVHIREPRPLYLVKSGSIEYYIRQENIARTIDMLFQQYGTDALIQVSKTDKTI